MSDFLATVVKLNGQTAGRDKICRIVQYGSRLVYGSLEPNSITPELVVKLKLLEGALSGARKVFRIGKSLDMISSALKSMQLSDLILRLTITTSRLTQAIYLLVDHIIWSQKIGLISDKNKHYYSNLSNRFWATTLTMNLLRNLYDVIRIYNHASLIAKDSAANGHRQPQPQKTSMQVLSECIRNNPPVFLDLLKNLCDVILPLSNLKFVSTSTQTQGFVGLVSSLIGLATIVRPALKLVP